MPETDVPTREQLVQRASDLVPLLQKNAAWSEENRRLHDETVEALADAGIFRMRVPARYGGFECDTRTLVDVATQLGRGDGSTAWTASVYWIPGWMACMFPDQVQDEVFSAPNVRVCGTQSTPTNCVGDSTETRTNFTMQWLNEDGATPFLRAAQSGDPRQRRSSLGRARDSLQTHLDGRRYRSRTRRAGAPSSRCPGSPTPAALANAVHA